MHNLHVLETKSSEDLRREIEKIGADPGVVDNIPANGILRLVKVERAKIALARFLFQELAMEGGVAVMKPRMWHWEEGETDVLLIGTHVQLQHLVVRLATQPDEEIAYLAQELDRTLGS